MRNLKNNSWLFGLLMIACLITACDGNADRKAPADTIAKTASNVRKKVIIEIVAAKDSDIDNDGTLHNLAKAYHLDMQNLTAWKNRVAIYGELSNPESLIADIRKRFPGDSVKYFDAPFYNFNRKMCSDTISSTNQTNIFLSADLVADPKMQQEYLNYHKTQFGKWPEVSNGFCNASFQQLLVFKSGRQLFIVISIPKGKTLDELNPLTTKNNPRVNDWNKLMSKYQEGLPGTKKGETWVFFKPVK